MKRPLRESGQVEKSAQSIKRFVHKYLNQTFQCTRRIKTHLLNYHSQQTVVMPTGLPGLLLTSHDSQFNTKTL